jgi:putative endonuclease
LSYVYILRCADDTLYTGSTNDLNRRVNTNNSGKGAKYTRTRRPVALVYFEEWESWSAALRREAAIKKLSRGEKLALIQGKRKTASPEKVSG